MIGSRNKLGQIIGEKPIIKKCEVCGKEFKVYLSMIKRGRGKFCSKKCFSINNSKKMKGEPSRSKGKHWKMSEEIKKRLKGRNKGKHLAPQTEFKKCRINNKDCSGKVIAHHILSWSEFPELRYNINNGITLCLAHHPRKRAEEKRLIPFFMGLVPVSKEKIWQIM